MRITISRRLRHAYLLTTPCFSASWISFVQSVQMKSR
nr:MAG TPA: hypothetical protein [Caudoviricetes sp.]